MSHVKVGGCLCGGVRYQVNGPLRPIVACHCTQCRKTSGHYVAATQCLCRELAISGETLRWFKSSPTAERGFCYVCGSNLFWRRFGNDHVSIWAGTIDGETGLRMESQMYPEFKGDYYSLPDVPVIGLEQLK
jgi:hypothetical protein